MSIYRIVHWARAVEQSFRIHSNSWWLLCIPYAIPVETNSLWWASNLLPCGLWTNKKKIVLGDKQKIAATKLNRISCLVSGVGILIRYSSHEQAHLVLLCVFCVLLVFVIWCWQKTHATLIDCSWTNGHYNTVTDGHRTHTRRKYIYKQSNKTQSSYHSHILFICDIVIFNIYSVWLTIIWRCINLQLDNSTILSNPYTQQICYKQSYAHF